MNLLRPPRVLPSILCANVRSAFHKLDEIRATLQSRSIDIFVCTETWFSANIDYNATSIKDYVCLRDDRDSRIGGGVAFWIRSDIMTNLVKCSHPSGFECLVVKLPAMKLFLMALYLPPNIANCKSSSISAFIISTLDNLLMNDPQFDVVIAGDLNRFDVTGICCSLNLRNINNRPTYSNAELDYILLSESLCDCYSISLCAPFDRSKVPHLSLLASPAQGSLNHSRTLVRRVYDLRTSFIDSFVSEVGSADWSFLDNDHFTVSDKCLLFQTLINRAANDCIPVSFVKFSASDKPWITPLVKDLINKRWNAYRRGDYASYNHLKIKVRNEIQKAKFLWTSKMQEHDMWKMVRTHLGRNASSPIMSLISQYDSIFEALNSINSYLSSVCTPSHWSSIDEIVRNLPDDDIKWNIDTSPYNILRILQKLPKHKSSPDIPNVLYRHAAHQLAFPLSKLLRESFNVAQVPKPWKKAVIAPIPKNRTPSIEDIRPISLLSPLSKVMEKIVLSSIKDTLLDNYEKYQFGFRPNSSTQCALLSLHDQTTRYLDDPSTFGVLVISYDYSKAFDRLRFDLIIQRFASCGFPSIVIKWMSDYLKNRTQCVRIGEVESDVVEVTSGVPQGSILGPFLYSFATATYSPLGNHCHVLKYADDTSLVFPLFKASDNKHVVEEHRHLLQWSAENGLKMNVKKCNALAIRKPNISRSITLPLPPDIQVVDTIRILGILFNDRLTWTSHVNFIIKKCSRLLFAFRTIRLTVPSSKLKLLYFTLVRSVIEYCAPLLTGLSSFDSHRLECLQNRFHKLICSTKCDTGCLPPLSERRQQLTLNFLQRILRDDHILHDILPPRSKSGRFLLPPRKTTRRSKSFVLFACESYNHSIKR